MFEQRIVGAELMFMIVMGEGITWKRKESERHIGFSPPILDLLWKAQCPSVGPPWKS